MKKTILCIILATISGGLLGKITFSKYENLNIKNVIKLEDRVYVLKYGEYDSQKSMFDNVIDIDRYIYLEENNKYKVYIGMTKTRNSINKINKLYNNKYKIEKIHIDNEEFIQNLDEYEKLLDVANDNQTLSIIENQILSSYEKLVVNNE